MLSVDVTLLDAVVLIDLVFELDSVLLAVVLKVLVPDEETDCDWVVLFELVALLVALLLAVLLALLVTVVVAVVLTVVDPDADMVLVTVVLAVVDPDADIVLVSVLLALLVIDVVIELVAVLLRVPETVDDRVCDTDDVTELVTEEVAVLDGDVTSHPQNVPLLCRVINN